jgi:Sugar phosphate isomerases/epimerases
MPRSGDREGGGGPRLAVSLAQIELPTLAARLDWAADEGFAGVEVPVTGAAGMPHAPGVSPDERAFLRDSLSRFDCVALEAPNQATFDLSLVSPSPAIRRASVSELWAVCRLAEAVGAKTVLVRTGNPPMGLAEARAGAYLGECLKTLDRMAGDHDCRLALLNADMLSRLVAFSFLEGAGFRHIGVALDLGAARALGEPDAAAARFADVHAASVLHRRVPAGDDPVRYTGYAAGKDIAPGDHGCWCLVFDRLPPDPEASLAAIAARRAQWQEVLGSAA